MSYHNLQENTDNKTLRDLRDTLKNHAEEIRKSGKITERPNNRIYYLTMIMAIIAIIEFSTKILPIIMK